MERVKENEQVRKEEEASNSMVSFSALREEVVNVLDFMERLKNEEDQKAVDVDLIEKLKLKLTFIGTYVQLSYSDFDQFEDIVTGERQEVENLLRTILDDVDNTISSHHRSKSDGTMMEEQLNFLLLNLHHLAKYRAENIYPLVTKYGILQNVCANIGDFHGLIVNGCIKHEIIENVLLQFQLMAESVGNFLWKDQIDQDSQHSELDKDDQNDGDSQQYELDEDDQTDGDSQLSELDEDDHTDGDSQPSELDEDDQTDEDSQPSEMDEDDQTNGDSQPSELDKDDQTDGESQQYDLDEDDQNDGDSQQYEPDEDDQTDGDSQLSELDEDDHTDGDSQPSELDEDDQTDGDSQPSEMDEDDQTNGGSQPSELDKDDQTDGDSQQYELDEDDQTDGDSQLSELDEDDHTDGDSQPSELDEDDQTDGDSQPSEMDEDDQTNGGSQPSELDKDDQTDGDSQQLMETLNPSSWMNDQTDGDSQPSELDEDDQTDGDSQPSKLDEDDQTDGDSQKSEIDKDDQTDGGSQPSELDEDDQTDEDSRLFKLAHLITKIIPIELEVMHICYTNLKASPSAEVRRFIKHLLETSPDNLGEYLIHLQEHMVTVITASTSGARNIHIMIEFLLIILTDMPKDFVYHEKLFDLLGRVGVLIKEVSTLVHGLEEKSRNEESIDETSCATLDLLKNIELLKKDLKYVYLKSPDSYQYCFPMNDGLLFMHLLHIHLKDFPDSNAYSIVLIKEEIGLVKEYLEFIRSFFRNVEQGSYKDLWAHSLDVAYVAKDVIDSIIVRDNGLLHLIFSLPISIKTISLIREEVSNLLEKIPKNRSRLVVNSPKKSLTGAKIILGFKEETNWLISKLTSGPKDLDVISITGMPGSGKTTLAYKVYNDESVCSHFDIRACKDIDVSDKLRKQLYRKRYLIVLDDVRDTATWDDLTRPFPEVEKGSRIILTTRQKEVAFHGKCNTDPRNLRLLSPEESWELLEKRAFGEQSFPDELLDAGKEIAKNCKGLPLVADLIAGVIAAREKTKSVWLEPCFLYLASYPKDTTMARVSLKMYWCAKGLVEQTEMMSVEEMMELYLDNLISSILSSLSLSSKVSRHSAKHLNSLFMTGYEMEDRLSDACHLRDLRLLRVLVLKSSFMMVKDSLLNKIGMLNHLRFLFIGTEVKSLPSSFSNLWNLETLFIDNGGSTLVLLPRIWDLVKLRGLFMNSGSFFDLDTDEPILIAEDSKLENVRELETLVLSYSKETEDIFKRVPNLQRLVFDLKESWDYLTKRYWFLKLDSLTELDYLRADFESSNANDSEPSSTTNWSWDFHFPSNLKTLVLCDFPLTSNSLSTIVRLPNLEDLFLTRTIIKGDE
ncbi:hypothetical protein CQW23_31371 [Capsicum baccatum]|uniref:NB-ARC domain-containing protein n=1 Tax=Capsicum baccatum TaxID=33114 RepID=A0A2G2V7Z2_CAPBA|nr:hypothetical protein CQW23_31371 [Capsicum baccatum]